LKNKINSLIETSAGTVCNNFVEKPNIIFIQDLKKKVGPSKYKKISKNNVQRGKRSKKKEKNKISEIKKMDPGKPKNIKMLSKTNRNNFGHK
jgi:hypothetical protein